MIHQLLESSRPTKRVISVIYDTLALCLSLYIAWALRLGKLAIDPTQKDLVCLGITVFVSIYAFVRLGLYRAILRYMAQDAVVSIASGLLISSLTLAASDFFLSASIPRSVPVIYLLLATFLIGLPRLMVRNIVQMLLPVGDTKVLIYGAGSAGRMLTDSLRPSRDYQPVAFLDDNPKLWNSNVKGLPVHPGKDAEKLIKKYRCEKIFLALGAVDRPSKHLIIRQLEKLKIQIQTIPPLEELTKGRLKIDEIRDIQIEDLLGRDPVAPDLTLMESNIRNKAVMVTGAGGSIGSELCRQIIQHQPKHLILFELNEYNLYAITEELQSIIQQDNLNLTLIPLLGNVQDKQRLTHIMKLYQVNTLYHAAAYKHVPLVEQNIIEGIKNNVFGTLRCAQSAIEANVGTFVLISTDKAVRPTNLMGASKRLAELILQALNIESNTLFCMVRFGNVLGSSGSVVPKFRQQIEDGGPITVTHPEITRYFMTTKEASQLVIQAGAMAQGGEVFVLEMGEPVKIADMAKEMISLSGLSVRDTSNPEGEIEVQYTGLRSGEKLFEELLIGNNCEGTAHPRIMRSEEEFLDWETVEVLLNKIKHQCSIFDFEALRKIIMEAPTAYAPNNSIQDLTHTILADAQISRVSASSNVVGLPINK
ncbi:polysaccharide biosynthesis protein [Aestuariicella hydrocarbonica]|uniref:Polysaccharide biosynthesis protein n=1 Tax=Pseudomaricurvus hydrocarbonicus TaxID=1470433 RepID=A0A9E5MLG5_9GAMM|nr:nucleoside-diphosphate sugar epimerase/dehydratase [Aestuariicella hydrocarbonica]NHO64463.1 polysaccharide biosynthesis protein [Aestuariicella hydrocarbonica]